MNEVYDLLLSAVFFFGAFVMTNETYKGENSKSNVSIGSVNRVY